MGSHGRKQYAADFKRDAVALVIHQGYSVAEAAKTLGVNAGLLRRWKTEVERTGGRSRFRGKATKSPNKRTLMRQPGVKVRLPRRWLPRTTDRDHVSPVAVRRLKSRSKPLEPSKKI